MSPSTMRNHMPASGVQTDTNTQKTTTHTHIRIHMHIHKNAGPYACKYAAVMNPAFNGPAKRIWGHIVSFTQMNWAVCPLNRLPFFLAPAPPAAAAALPLFTLAERRCTALRFSIELLTLHHFISVSISETASCSRPVFVILFVSPSLSHSAQPAARFRPQPLSAWAQFLRLRLSHCQNGGKAQSVTIPRAVRLRTKCLLIFFPWYSCPPPPFHPFLRNLLMQCRRFAESLSGF